MIDKTSSSVWSRAEKIALAGVLATLVGVIAGITAPELRTILGFTSVEGAQQVCKDDPENPFSTKTEIRGEVTDGITQEPINGARVAVTIGDIKRDTETNQKGHFCLGISAGTQLTIEVSKAGYKTDSLGPLTNSGEGKLSFLLYK